MHWRRQPKEEKERLLALNTDRQKAYEALWKSCYVKMSEDGRFTWVTPNTVSVDELMAYMKAQMAFDAQVDEDPATYYDYEFIPLCREGMVAPTTDPILTQIRRMSENDGASQEDYNPRGPALTFLMENGCHNITCRKIATSACSKCKTASYCSTVCQQSHWFKHKKVCK